MTIMAVTTRTRRVQASTAASSPLLLLLVCSLLVAATQAFLAAAPANSFLMRPRGALVVGEAGRRESSSTSRRMARGDVKVGVGFVEAGWWCEGGDRGGCMWNVYMLSLSSYVPHLIPPSLPPSLLLLSDDGRRQAAVGPVPVHPERGGQDLLRRVLWYPQARRHVFAMPLLPQGKDEGGETRKTTTRRREGRGKGRKEGSKEEWKSGLKVGGVQDVFCFDV